MSPGVGAGQTLPWLSERIPGHGRYAHTTPTVALLLLLPLQHDLHIPVLTVGETLAFAHAATSGGAPDFSTLEELNLPP